MVAVALSVALALLVTWLGLAMAYFSVYPLGFYVTTLSFGAFVIARTYRRTPVLARRRNEVRALARV
jgi:zinc/manganese transport system permease protein